MALKSVSHRHKMRIPCPKCARNISEYIGRLRRSPKLHCPFCGAAFTVQARQFDRGVRQVEQVLENFTKKLGRTRNEFKFRL